MKLRWHPYYDSLNNDWDYMLISYPHVDYYPQYYFDPSRYDWHWW